MRKLLAVLLTAVLILQICACTPGDDPLDPTNPVPTAPPTEPTQSAPTEPPEPTEPEPEVRVVDNGPLENYQWGSDYTSLWEAFGDSVSIDDVVERNGTAYIVRDGYLYELGLDFLSRAMIERTAPSTSAYYSSEKDIFSHWWRLYNRRYHSLMPELPLCSDQSWSLAGAGVTGFAPTLYHTELSCLPACAGQEPLRVGTVQAVTDDELRELTKGMALTEPDGTGDYRWNDVVVKQHREIRHADGAKTYMITIRKDLKLSNGTQINAASYLVEMMAQSTQQGQGSVIGCRLRGWGDFHNNSTLSEDGPVFSGVHLLSDDTLSLTVRAEYLPDYFELAYLSLTPAAVSTWLGKAEIVDNGEGCYLTKEFYTKDRQEQLQKAAQALTGVPASGPYTVAAVGEKIKLERNPYYAGQAPVSERITIQTGEASVLAEKVAAGELDLALGLTGTEDAGQAKWISRPLAQYGRMCFRADYGPASFPAVRRAIAAAMDADAICGAVTSDRGVRPAGAYGKEFFALSGAAEADAPFFQGWQIAEQMLIEDGWIYNADGSQYTAGSGIRYRKLAPSEQTAANLSYRAGEYATTQVGEDYYMPLALNWFSSENSSMASVLLSGWASSRRATEAIGLAVFQTVGTTRELLDHYRQSPVNAEEAESEDEEAQTYTVFDMTIDYSTAVFDYRENWTVDPNRFEAFSLCYVKDAADIYWPIH